MKNRKDFSIERHDELEELTMDSGKTAAIFEAMKTTIGLLNFFQIIFSIVNVKISGMDISPIDLINIESFAKRVIHLFEYRKSLQEVNFNDDPNDCERVSSIWKVKWDKWRLIWRC